MRRGVLRARASRAAPLVVARGRCLALGALFFTLLCPTAVLAQDGAAPPSPVPNAPAKAPPAAPAPSEDPAKAEPPPKKPDAKPDPNAGAKAEPKAPAPKPDLQKPADAPAKPSAPTTSPPVGASTAPNAVPPAPTKPKPKPPLAPPPTVTAPVQKASAAKAPAPAAPAVTKPTPPDVDERTLQLERDVKAALANDPPDVRRLEELCGAWQPRRVFDERPLLGAILPLCLGRAAMLQDRDEHADKKLREALVALGSIPVDDDALEVRAEILFRQAELAERAIASFERCGSELGLRRLSSWEGVELAGRLDHATSAYREVVRTGPRGWARRALLRTGALYDAFYRQVAGTLPKTYVGVALPSPFLVEEHDGAALLESALDPKMAAWPREIARLYDAVYEELSRAGDAPKLLADVEERRRAFRSFEALPRELVRNPWLDDIKPGLLRRTQRGFEERTAQGSWRVLTEAEGRARIDAALSGGVRDIESAWAMVALSSAGVPVDIAVLEQALASADERIRLSALIALGEHPRAELYEGLVTTWQKVAGTSEKPLFASLQEALFGARERTVVALRALADRERDLAGKLAEEPRLPVQVRAYLLAELGDYRLLPHYQRLAATGDPTTTAVALYGMYLASGRRMLWSLRPHDPDPVGCVSRHLKALEDENARMTSSSLP